MKTEAGVSAGPAKEPREHPHDSLRVDGWLDTCCLRCGADGYWRDGDRIDPAGRATEIHPSGKTLVAADG